MEEIYDRLTDIFKDVFDDNSITLNEDTTANDIDEWDSLNHITLIAAVEEEFGITFTMGEVSSMKNVGEMVEIINERSNNA